MSRPVRVQGAAAWSILLRLHGADPKAAMLALSKADASADQRAKLAVAFWPGERERAAALATLRSPRAVRRAVVALGWLTDEGLQVPLADPADLARLCRMLGA